LLYEDENPVIRTPNWQLIAVLSHPMLHIQKLEQNRLSRSRRHNRLHKSLNP
jgi:hypothetical protein